MPVEMCANLCRHADQLPVEALTSLQASYGNVSGTLGWDAPVVPARTVGSVLAERTAHPEPMLR